MKPLTDTMRKRLDAAMDYVLSETANKATPEDIIAGMTEHHGAKFGFGGGSTYHLRCAGANATNTAGDQRSILRAWRRNAIIRLGQML